MYNEIQTTIRYCTEKIFGLSHEGGITGVIVIVSRSGSERYVWVGKTVSGNKDGDA